MLGETLSRTAAAPAAKPARANVLAEEVSRTTAGRGRSGVLALTGFSALLWAVAALAAIGAGVVVVRWSRARALR